jgi:cytochrome c peroxidase
MKKVYYLLVLFVSLLAFTISSCKKENTELKYKFEYKNPKLPENRDNYSKIDLPNHMNTLEAEVAKEVTDEGATLGRVLFFDKFLSKNNTTSCSSCHIPEKAFADSKDFSVGFEGQKTTRNANTIVNAVMQSNYFWDGREGDLKQMVLQPVKNHIEMGLDRFDVLEEKLKSLPYYKNLFINAYGDEAVTQDRIADALKQFIVSIVSSGSKAEEVPPVEWGGELLFPPSFTEEEKEGARLFHGKANCSFCHKSSTFKLSNFADIGLDAVYDDNGKGEIDGVSKGMFKIPNLTNIAVTGPYMHDGRFKTLEEVVNHYSENIQDSPNLSWELRDFNDVFNPNAEIKAKKFNFTDDEKKNLVAFLHTFTDSKFLTDPKFSDPFK